MKWYRLRGWALGLGFLLCLARGDAQTSLHPFGPPQKINSFPGGCSIQNVLDYDGDGDPDVLGSNNVFYENDGRIAPSFTAHPMVLNNAGSLLSFQIKCMTDVNRDGLVDIIYTYSAYDSMENIAHGFGYGESLGKGQFACRSLWQLSGSQNHNYYESYDYDNFTLADMDNDGKTDIVYNECYSWSADDSFNWGATATVECMRNLGGNPTQFASPVTLNPSGKGFASPYNISDLNGDGILDLLVVDSYAFNEVPPNSTLMSQIRTQNTIAQITSSTTLHAFQNELYDFAPYDFDQDGKLEIMLREWNSGEHKIGYLKNGVYHDCYPGTSVDWVSTLVNPDHPGLWEFLIARTSGFWGMRYDPASSSHIRERLLFTWASDQVLSARVRTFPTRGPGILVHEKNGNTNQVLRYYQDTGHIPLAGIPVYVANGNLNYIVADFNGDMFPDLLIHDPNNGLFLLPNIDSQNFTSHTLASPTTGPEAAWPVDWDGDRRIDVLAAVGGENKIVLLHHDGGAAPSFSSTVLTDAAAKPMDLCAADLDRDGKLEIVAACQGDSSIAWFSKPASPGAMMDKHVLTTQALGARAVATADLDKDGDLDILAASLDNNTFWWFENNGARPPVFTAHTLSTQYAGARAITAADMDGDGDLDVLCGARDANTIVWFENNGQKPPSFTAHVIDNACDSVRGVAAADFDGDGVLEVAAVSSDDNTVAWYEGNGARPPVFTKHVISTTAIGARALAIGDFNRDGHPDILVMQPGDGAIVWFINDGARPPHFTRRAVGVQQGDISGVAAADLNGDGYPDAIGTMQTKAMVCWYENLLGKPQAPAAARMWEKYQ